jgi:hypothetical protein
MRVDSDGKLSIVTHNKGYFATEAALNTAYPTASDGDYAIVGATDTVWVWDSGTSAWVDSGLGSLVTSVFTRVGDVVAVADDYVFAPQVLTDAATIGWDVDNGHKAEVTLAGNRILGAPTNLKSGGRYVLYCIQDGTGSRTLDFSNAIFKFPGGTEPVLSTAAGTIDIIAFEYDGTSLFGVANYAFS